MMNRITPWFLLVAGVLPGFSHANFAKMPARFLDKIQLNTPNINSFIGVGCDSSGLICLGVGYSNGLPLSYKTTDGGTTWSNPVSPELPSPSIKGILSSVACDGSGSNCVSTGGSLLASGTSGISLSYLSTDGGLTWNMTEQMVDAEESIQTMMTSIACDSAGQQCIATGYSVNGRIFTPVFHTSTDGGNSWSDKIQLPFPARKRSVAIVSMACDTSNASTCLVMGAIRDSGSVLPVSYTTTDRGATWQAPVTLSLPDNATNTIVTDVSCDNDAVNCTAVGTSEVSDQYEGVIYTTTDSGASWSAPAVVTAPVGSVTTALSTIFCGSTGLSCVTAGFFVLADGVIRPLAYATSDGGSSWNTPFLFVMPDGNPDTAFLFEINCDKSMHNCLTVGTSITGETAQLLAYTSSDGGVNWGNPVLPASP